MPMPLADLFQPDINFVSARAVYPTASGGSLASAGAAMTESTNTVVPAGDGTSAPTTVTAGPAMKMSGHTIGWWFGAVLFLVTLVWVARKAGGEEDFRNIRPTVYNFMTITLTSILGIVGAKVIAAKYRIPGASDIILAV